MSIIKVSPDFEGALCLFKEESQTLHIYDINEVIQQTQTYLFFP